jgi:hypothetical protein
MLCGRNQHLEITQKRNRERLRVMPQRDKKRK